MLTCAFGTGDAALFHSEFEPLFRASEEGCSFCERALTSPRVISKLKAAGIEIKSLDEAFDALIKKGVKDLRVNALLLADGAEYQKIQAACEKRRASFDSLTLIEPLLTRDAEACAKVLSDMYPCEEGRHVVLLGHGSMKNGNEDYIALQNALARDDMHVVLTETDEPLDLAPYKGQKVLFAPLMLCAGHHIQELYACLPDLCREKSIADSYVREGLGAVPAFRELFKRKD